MEISSHTIQFLLQSNPWTAYRTRLDLLVEAPDKPEVQAARRQMIVHPKVAALVEELNIWPGKVLNSHKSAGQLYHKLAFLADLGLQYDDPGMAPILDKVMAHASEEGPFQLPMSIPVHFGGTGEDQYAWALCDAPTLVYSLAKMGLKADEKVVCAKNHLFSLGRPNGYPCAVSKELGKFRGPGKKDDPCPYATLIMLKLLSLYEEDCTSGFARQSVDSLLNLWEHSTALHPYQFCMGTDFRKIKAPLIWYDILHVTDTLSNFPYAVQDGRFHDMLHCMLQKAGPEGFFTPESIWKAWDDWDFGQKKQPSAWLTFLVYRIAARANGLRLESHFLPARLTQL